MEQSPSWEAYQFSASQEVPRILWNPEVHCRIYKCPHLSLSGASSIQSIPPITIFWRSILILSSHVYLSLPSVLFTSGFPTKTLYSRLLSPIRASCPAHLTLLDLIIWIIINEENRSLSSSLCSFLHYPVTSSLLGPRILLNTLFSNTLRLRSSLNVSDQVSYPYKTTGIIIVLYILIFIFLDRKLEDKISASSDRKHSLPSICS